MQNKHFNIDIKMAGKRIKALFMSAVHQIQGMMMTG